jgi:hypothetical protein
MLTNPKRQVHAAALISTSVLPESNESRANREKTIAAMQTNFPKVVEGILKFSTHEASDAELDALRKMQLAIGCEAAVRQTHAIMGRSDHRAKLSTLTLPLASMVDEVPSLRGSEAPVQLLPTSCAPLTFEPRSTGRTFCPKLPSPSAIADNMLFCSTSRPPSPK